MLIYGYMDLALVRSADIAANDPDSVHCDEDEAAYLLDSLLRCCRASSSTDRRSSPFSRGRPLPVSDASIPGLISRDHSSPTLKLTRCSWPFPVVALVEGKWTTFAVSPKRSLMSCFTVLGAAERSRPGTAGWWRAGFSERPGGSRPVVVEPLQRAASAAVVSQPFSTVTGRPRSRSCRHVPGSLATRRLLTPGSLPRRD